jgi:hypothetical protein
MKPRKILITFMIKTNVKRKLLKDKKRWQILYYPVSYLGLTVVIDKVEKISMVKEEK